MYICICICIRYRAASAVHIWIENAKMQVHAGAAGGKH